jgi:hypothetical protein
MPPYSPSSQENRRFRWGWTDQELLTVLDLYFNEHETDSHGHEGVARCMGRYNANTRSYNDGAINQKLSEIKGLVERSRMPRHSGERIQRLVEEWGSRQRDLRRAAIAAWRDILQTYSEPIPLQVRCLMGAED